MATTARRRVAPIMTLAAVVLAGLTACGKKPGDVSPPLGSTAEFPSTYPNPKYDPKPAGTAPAAGVQPAERALPPPVTPGTVMPSPSPFDPAPVPVFRNQRLPGS